MKQPAPSTPLDDKRQKLKYVIQNLEAAYGIPSNTRHDDPLDELIETIRKLDQEIENALNATPKADRESLAQQAGYLKNRIQSSLNEVIALENACRDILESQKTGINNQMKTLKERKSVLGKYQSTFSKNSSFSKDA